MLAVKSRPTMAVPKLTLPSVLVICKSPLMTAPPKFMSSRLSKVKSPPVTKAEPKSIDPTGARKDMAPVLVTLPNCKLPLVTTVVESPVKANVPPKLLETYKGGFTLVS